MITAPPEYGPRSERPAASTPSSASFIRGGEIAIDGGYIAAGTASLHNRARDDFIAGRNCAPRRALVVTGGRFGSNLAITAQPVLKRGDLPFRHFGHQRVVLLDDQCGLVHRAIGDHILRLQSVLQSNQAEDTVLRPIHRMHGVTWGQC
jgi:hypothetical protein